MAILQELRDDGSLLIIKWLIIGAAIGVLLGIMTGATKVILFETSKSGGTATYKTCIDYDDEAAQRFEEQYTPDPREKGTPPDFCRQYGTATRPTGERARKEMELYGLLGGGFGFTVGLIIGHQKSEKRKYQERLRLEQKFYEEQERKRHKKAK